MVEKSAFQNYLKVLGLPRRSWCLTRDSSRTGKCASLFLSSRIRDFLCAISWEILKNRENSFKNNFGGKFKTYLWSSSHDSNLSLTRRSRFSNVSAIRIFTFDHPSRIGFGADCRVHWGQWTLWRPSGNTLYHGWGQWWFIIIFVESFRWEILVSGGQTCWCT